MVFKVNGTTVRLLLTRPDVKPPWVIDLKWQQVKLVQALHDSAKVQERAL